MLTDKVRLFPPDIQAGINEVPPLATLIEQLKAQEIELAKAKAKLGILEAESVKKTKEEDKLVSDKQLTELQLQLQELRDAMIEYIQIILEIIICLKKRQDSN